MLSLFNEDAQCPKCGHDEILTGYCHKYHKHPYKIGDCYVAGEHLHRKCERCGYIWEEMPLNMTTGELEDAMAAWEAMKHGPSNENFTPEELEAIERIDRLSKC